MKKIEVVINRSKWRTGLYGPCATGQGETQLRNKEGFKCCLGFISTTIKKRLTGKVFPDELNCTVPELSETDSWGLRHDTELTRHAIEINDDEELSLEEKEKQLKELFKDSRYKLKFKGEAVLLT